MLTVWEEREESSFSRWWMESSSLAQWKTFSLLLDRENLDDKSARYFNFSKGEALGVVLAAARHPQIPFNFRRHGSCARPLCVPLCVTIHASMLFFFFFLHRVERYGREGREGRRKERNVCSILFPFKSRMVFNVAPSCHDSSRSKLDIRWKISLFLIM